MFRIFFRFLKLIKCLKVNIYYPLRLLMPQRRLTLWRIWSTFDQFKLLRNSWYSREIHMSIKGKEKRHISLSLTWIFLFWQLQFPFSFLPNVSWLIVSRFHLPKALRFQKVCFLQMYMNHFYEAMKGVRFCTI